MHPKSPTDETPQSPELHPCQRGVEPHRNGAAYNRPQQKQLHWKLIFPDKSDCAVHGSGCRCRCAGCSVSRLSALDVNFGRLMTNGAEWVKLLERTLPRFGVRDSATKSLRLLSGRPHHTSLLGGKNLPVGGKGQVRNMLWAMPDTGNFCG